ncbi:MAG: hypothetical protein M0Q91_00640 [Methanoregula sp.]|jgi:hypothetical protein|nr:hypothetical protein [Methanoregula sp.]
MFSTTLPATLHQFLKRDPGTYEPAVDAPLSAHVVLSIFYERRLQH